MRWVILHSNVTELLESCHPFRYLFQLITYNDHFIAFLVLPAPLQASFSLFFNGREHVCQYGQFVRTTLRLSSSAKASSAFPQRSSGLCSTSVSADKAVYE
jgi:hypothetical protein